MNRKRYVAGMIQIPVYFPISCPSDEEALKQVEDELNYSTISMIDGDISTWSGKVYPVLARRVRVTWHDIVREEDVI